MSTSGARTYVSPLREAGAFSTRRQILAAAVEVFQERGWSGATLGRVAAQAGVSAKTIQAQFGTKPVLLADTVDFAIRGEGRAKAGAGRGAGQDGAGPGAAQDGAGRGAAQAIRTAATAAEALALHAAMITDINARAAVLAGVVEAGAAGDPALAPLWQRMRENMQFGVRWAAETVRARPGIRVSLSAEAVETVFQIAMAWSTYRTLASARGMSRVEIETWIREFYERMLLG
jgi:AcrR family transcriptional regulator